MSLDLHRLVSGRTGTIRIVIKQRRWFGNFLIIEPSQVFRSWLPITVRRFVLEHQHERFLWVSVIFQPFECLLTNDVCCVSNVVPPRGFRLNTSIEHRRIVVGTLTYQHIEIVISLGRRLKMPFPDHGRLIPGRVKKLWESLLRTIKGVPVSNKAIQMAVLTRLDNRSARAANAIGNIATVELNPILSNTIHIWRGHPRSIIRTQGLLTVIIRKDKNNIGARVLCQSHHDR